MPRFLIAKFYPCFLKYIRFGFIIERDIDIGFNYRNNFAHYKNIKSDDFNYSTTLKITQILICIINQLSLNVKE